MGNRLTGYRRKRDFTRTPEPAGTETSQAGAAFRFVIQEHHARRLHWDFRLERDGVLVSWALPRGIPVAPRPNHLAVHVEDHPLDYIAFEGEIADGNYGAGRVTVWDHGTYTVEKWQDDEVKVVLAGSRVSGRYVLFQTEGKNWMIHRMDPPSNPEFQAMPDQLVPMMARLSTLPAAAGAYGYEYKWDGERALARIDGGQLRLTSRTGNDLSAKYPELRPLAENSGGRQLLLDGEIVALGEDGRPSFQRLQLRMGLTRTADIRKMAAEVPVAYVVFDLLHLDGTSLLAEGYETRRRQLEELKLQGEAWWVPPFERDGAALLRRSRELDQEGIMAKRLDSPYEAGKRSGAWLKIKNHNRQEFVVGGWSPGEGRRAGAVGALLLGYHEDGALQFAGKVGTGFAQRDLDHLQELLTPLEQASSPFSASRLPPRVRFVRPEVVVEIQFAEWTRAGTLRQPSFKGIRDDRPAAEVGRERREAPPPPGAPLTSAAPAARRPRDVHEAVEVEVDGRTLRLTNLDKVLYPGAMFTKAQVIDYYRQVAPALLPHLAGRPLTLKRYPNGVDEKFFFEKRAPRHRPPWVTTAEVAMGGGKTTIEFLVIDTLPALIWVANLAALELHTPMALAAKPDQPRMVVFDLDPGEGTTIVDCCRVAVELRRLLGELKLESFAKTSGSKGLQPYVPLNAATTSEETKGFALAVAEELARRMPGKVVTRQEKALRRGRILVDWSQNDRSKTTICAYSLRAREQPTVSTPVTWDEVERCLQKGNPDLLRFGARDVLERLEDRGDLFAPVLRLRQRLRPGGVAQSSRR